MSTTIPVSSIVNVSIGVTPAAPSRAGFGKMLVVTTEAGISLLETIRDFANIGEVAAVYNSSTEAYKAALAWFSQVPRPTVISIARRFTAAQAGSIQGGVASTTLTDYTTVTTGSLHISMDGASGVDVTAIDFSAATDLAGVASALQTKLRAVASGGFTLCTVTHDSSGHFIITSGTTGASSAVSYATTAASGADISSLLKLRQGQATKTNGIAAESVTAALDRINAKDSSWYFLGFTKETRDNSDVTSIAAWAEAVVKQYFTTTNNEDTLSAAITTDTAYTLHGTNYRRTCVVFSSHPDEYPEFSAAARAAIVDFGGEKTTITLKFKQLPGITTERLTSAQATALKNKGCNAFVMVGDFPMFQEGLMSKGVGTWQDTVHGVDWLQNAIETNVFAYLATRTTKVPYTDAGGVALGQQIEKALGEAVRNGLVAPSGYDADGNFLEKGYSITIPLVETATSDQKTQRQFPSITFYAIGAGAIHGVQINGTFEG